MITNIYIYVKPLWKVTGFFKRTSWKVSDVHIVRKNLGFVFFLRLSVSVSVSVCCVLCCCGARGCGGGRRRRGETNRTIWPKVPLEIT